MRARLLRGETVVVKVVTGSMSPTLRPGESVPVRRGIPALGDVVLLDTAGAPTLHRLVARLGPRWVHAGDLAGAGAGWCRDRDILGIAALPRRAPGLIAQTHWAWRALRRMIIP